MISRHVRTPVSGERMASHGEAGASPQPVRPRAPALRKKINTVPRSVGPMKARNARSRLQVVSAEEGGRWLDGFEGKSNVKPPTPLLDTVNYPIHMKNFSAQQLVDLAKELRAEVIYNVCNTGGHLGSSLGVVELTVALHHVFDTPDDKIIWDVGHQAYPHKILTGRRDQMKSLRQTDGLSPFTKMSESQHDAFGAGHSSTSISAGLGMAVGRDVKNRNNHVIAVIGDGAITGGMAYEAMNHAGYLDSNMIVILNDNQQVSLPTQFNNKNQEPYGALSSTLARIQAAKPLRELREVAKDVTKQLPGQVQEFTQKLDEYGRGMISGSGSTLFEELGLYYIGTVDGHNLNDLIAILDEVKNTESVGPVLIHVITEKGKGYIPAETAQDKYHGVARFDVATGKQQKGSGGVPNYTKFFADALIAEAKADPDVVAVHAAMGGGTGLNHFEKYFPDRTFDVGIAEQHAVTFCAGLASEGLKPFCAIYSTFLQRGYDQIVHDVSLQKLPVRFMIDRAGLVGADGPTHAGSFDVMYLASLPHFVVMGACDEAELCHMIATATTIDDGPCSVRYPRGNGLGIDLNAAGITRGPVEELKGTPLEIGKGRYMVKGSKVALLGFGMGTTYAMNAAELLRERGVEPTVADARFAKPLDHDLIRELVEDHDLLITVEEGCVGGFGSHVMQFLSLDGLMDDGNIKVRNMVLPDTYIDHGNPAVQLKDAGLSPPQIASTVLSLMGKSREALEVSQAA